MSADTQPAMTYPTSDQYERWKARAQEVDMSVSKFMQAMIEAGIKVDKGFELIFERDETTAELRDQRNALRSELNRARNRIARLEDRLLRSEREAVREFIEENPGICHAQVIQHVIDTVPERVNHHLEDLEAKDIHVSGESYYPVEEGLGSGDS